MNRRAFLAESAGVTALGLAGCVVEGGNEGGEYNVGMTASRFQPDAVTVAAGETVVWKNTSSHAHTVTAYEEQIPDDAAFFASGGFESQSAAEQGWIDGTEGGLYQGDTYEHTFEVPGTYSYFCIPHETGGMIGSVVVESATETEYVSRDR